MSFSDCTKCELHKSACYVGIPGRGASPADVMIVGQNPGWNEDQQGRVFVGKSGAELKRYLADAGLVGRVFVTNAVKCHTEGNAPPSNTHMKACREHLISEVATVRPRVIVALGNTALKVLTGASGITKYAGKLTDLRKEYGGSAVVIPTYHPAAVFRDPRYEQRIAMDLKRVASLLDEKERPPVPWHWCENPLTCVDWMRLFAFDFETSGLSYARDGARSITCAIADGSESVHVIRGDGKHFRAMCWGMLHSRRVGHNSIRFDDNFLFRDSHSAGIVPSSLSDDTMLSMALLDEEGVYSLEAGATRYLGVPPWKDSVTWDFAELDLATTPQATLDALAMYNARDARHTRDLWHVVSAKMDEAGVREVYEHILKPVTAIFEEISKRGVYVSIENIDEERAALEDVNESLRFELQALAMEQEFNHKSTAHVGHLLHIKWKLPVQSWTATKQPCTDKISLMQLQRYCAAEGLETYERWLTTLLALRKNEKQISTYFKPWKKLALEDPEQRVRPDYRTIGIVTGRTSSMNPNMQNIPRARSVRRMVAARPGWVRMETDESQLEMRLAAELSGCPTLTKAFVEGIDVHTLTASRLTGKPLGEVTAKERTDAKPANFSLLYGAEAWTLMQILLKDYGIVATIRECEAMRDAFFGLYNLWPWYEDVASRLKRDGLIRSKTGRIRHLPNINADDIDVRTEAIRMAVNFDDQSLGSDITLISLILTHRRIRERGLADAIWITDYIHDSIGAEVRVGYEQDFAQITQWAMTDGVKTYLHERFGVELRIPLVAETKSGPNWGEMLAYQL